MKVGLWFRYINGRETKKEYNRQIKKISSNTVVSTKGVAYSLNEIELEPISFIRDKKLSIILNENK